MRKEISKFLSAFGQWTGKYNELIKLAFVIVAAFWVLFEYKGKQEEARVERTIGYINQSTKDDLLKAEISMTKFLTNKATVEKLNSLPEGDKKAYADFMVQIVENSLMTEVWQTYNFYKSLAICVNANLCEAATACIRFRRDLDIFIENFGPYFERYRSEHHDDALKPIRTLLAGKSCTSSSEREEAMDLGTVPQWMTVIIALGAGGVAIWSICSQRSIARKRAAVDVFIKTEMDEKMIVAYDCFHAGLNEMKKAKNIEEFCKSDPSRPHYLAIRKYLNIHELIAVGIKENVLDETVCYEYWADTLTNGYSDAKPVIDYVRNRPKNKYTYSELEALNLGWLERKNKAAG